MKHFKKIRLYVGYLFFLSILLLAKPTVFSYGIGFVIVVLGEAIRTWAAGYIEKDKTLVRNGPYRLVRNPLYLGSFLIGLGAVIISHSPWLLLAFVLLFLSTYVPTILREEKFLAQKFAADYPNYQKIVPSFFPFKLYSYLLSPPPFFPPHLRGRVGVRGRMEEGGRGFSWQRVKKNKEFHTGIALFLILIILGLKLT